MPRKISWDKQAVDYLREAIRYIRLDSPQNADKVKEEVLQRIRALPQKPEVHPPDKYKTNNTNNNYRAFELHRLRVSYLVKEDEIIIARIRHTSQQPLNF